MKKAQGRSKIITRRFVLGVGVAVFLFMDSGSAHAIERLSINFDYVEERARRLAERPHEELASDIPDPLKAIDYHTYLDIHSDQRRTLWTEDNLPFRIAFSLPGYIYDYEIGIREFTATHVQGIPLATEFFNLRNRGDLAAAIPASLGYAGFSVYYPINNADELEELAVFLGASYFRIRAKGAVFGISARALALNTTHGEEEFPAFREFWLGKPTSNAESLVIYAILDGPSVAGAYRFELIPGRVTEVRVRTSLFFRRKVEQVGIAPLSSMFFFGSNSVHKPLDYRPRVHDSDGLLVRQPNGTYVWQPLVNPSDRLVSVYRYTEPAAFGLCQRERNFESYQDIAQGYQDRPSMWVEPGRGDWGPGSVVLYTFVAASETVDNVVAFWQPKKLPPTGTPISFEYTLYSSLEERSPKGYVAATRTGGPVWPHDRHQYIVDFKGKQLRDLQAMDGIEVVAHAQDGVRLERPILVRNPFSGGWRMTLQFMITDETLTMARITAFLTHKGRRLTETWSYVWTKEQQFPPTPQQQIHGTRPTEE